jgi:hypothetical protein
MGNTVTNKNISINDPEYELKGDSNIYTYIRDPRIHPEEVSKILSSYDKLNLLLDIVSFGILYIIFIFSL